MYENYSLLPVTSTTPTLVKLMWIFPSCVKVAGSILSSNLVHTPPSRIRSFSAGVLSSMSELLVGVCQMTSGSDVEKNLNTCRKLIKRAKERGAKVSGVMKFLNNTSIIVGSSNMVLHACLSLLKGHPYHFALLISITTTPQASLKFFNQLIFIQKYQTPITSSLRTMTVIYYKSKVK